MRTKLFLAFMVIILAALLSTIVFETMIIKDFENYASGVKEDQIYWILASLEGSYRQGIWDHQTLHETIHWSLMMGLDIRIIDTAGRDVLPLGHVEESLSPGMKRRMEELFQIHTCVNCRYAEFPIISGGARIGTLMVRSFEKKALAEKEAIFKERVRQFLYLYLFIAGIGSLLIGLMLTRYLSKPIMNLKKASEKIAEGDFSARVSNLSSDEVGNLAKTFNKMAESLQKEEDLRKRLMSNIAHELRTPLTIMKTHAEAMADGIVTDTKKGLDNITGEIDRLITLVKGIEDITAAEASFFSKGETTEIDLKELVAGLRDDLLPSFQNRGLYLAIESESSLIVTTDIEKLERVLRNILSNALKFTEKGGISMVYGSEGDKYFIEIADTGRGIPENEIRRIFTRFYRSENAGTEGLGLGLAIAKELVGVMGGEITSKSKVGEGTTFRVTLPV